ncbi:MAG: hypothetical protein KF773_07490 [Deltaproteobacteria bacterium]|nr:hypothetical protein [Deltaproteobacteria bacterium]
MTWRDQLQNLWWRAGLESITSKPDNLASPTTRSPVSICDVTSVAQSLTPIVRIQQVPRVLKLLSTIGFLAGCMPGEAPQPEATSTTEQSIVAAIPGIKNVNSAISWDLVAKSGVEGTYALAAAKGIHPILPENIVNAVWRDPNGCLHRKFMSDLDGVWRKDAALSSCGPGYATSPGAVSWAHDRLDVFWFEYVYGRTLLSHAYWDGNVWHYEDIGPTETTPTGVPAVASWGVGHIDVMWRDVSGDVRWRSFERSKKGTPGYNVNGWTLNEKIVPNIDPKVPVNTQISIVSPKVNSIHIGWRALTKGFTHHWTDDTVTWHPDITSTWIGVSPSLVSWGFGHVAAFTTQDSSKTLIHLDWSLAARTWSARFAGSTTAIGAPVAAAALGRIGRIDLLGASTLVPDMTSYTLSHTLFQESLTGFQTLGNPQPKFWCWAASAGEVVNWVTGAQEKTCEFVGSVVHNSRCCEDPPSEECLTYGWAEDVLQTRGFDWSTTDALDPFALRLQLQVLNMPVIVKHDLPGTNIGHLVTLHDIYAVNGEIYVVISDPGFNGGNWVIKYADYLRYDDTFQVDEMIYNIHR